MKAAWGMSRCRESGEQYRTSQMRKNTITVTADGEVWAPDDLLDAVELSYSTVLDRWIGTVKAEYRGAVTLRMVD